MRVAMALGVRTERQLRRLLYAHATLIPSAIRDVPQSSEATEAFARATALTEWDVEDMTFHHLCWRFECSAYRGNSIRFLGDTVRPYLRFCPRCVDEDGYYRLIWRMSDIEGCVIHDEYLREACAFCGHRIPPLSPLLRIGVCPTCRKDLRLCPSDPLRSDQKSRSETIGADLTYLLGRPRHDQKAGEFRKMLGAAMARYRRTRWSNKRTKVHCPPQLTTRTIAAMERGVGGTVTFTDYMVYRDRLRCRFVDLCGEWERSKDVETRAEVSGSTQGLGGLSIEPVLPDTTRQES